MNPLLDPSTRLVVGHRGAAGEAPENTIPSFRLALEHGAAALELDVRLSADGVPVVIHDALLDRTTDAAGPVSALTLSELRKLDAGAGFSRDAGRSYPWRGRGAGIPALGDVLEEFPDVPLIVELKEVGAQVAVRRLLLDLRAAERCVVAAADHRALRAFGEPPFLRGASRRDIARLFLRSRFGLPRHQPACVAYAVPASYMGLTVPTRRFVALAASAGRPVHVWTVNDASLARRLWSSGVCGLITDRPADLAPLLSRLPRA